MTPRGPTRSAARARGAGPTRSAARHEDGHRACTITSRHRLLAPGRRRLVSGTTTRHIVVVLRAGPVVSAAQGGGGVCARGVVPRAERVANHGERVVTGQRLMQASSDIFLGWLHLDSGIDGKARDFYGRQLKDWKGSAEIEQMIPRGLRIRGGLCLAKRPRLPSARRGGRPAQDHRPNRTLTRSRAPSRRPSWTTEQSPRPRGSQSPRGRS